MSAEDRKRRKRELVIMVCSIIVVAFLTYVENRVIHFGADFPFSNTILMFILININLLLLILLIFLVFRNVVKLLYDRKRKVMGAKLRTKLVVAFITLTFLPTIILFLFSISFITKSIEFWFSVPVEQALENSLLVGQSLYKHKEKNSQFFLERIAYQIQTKKLLDPANNEALSHYIKVVQRSFNIDAVEVYASNSNRLSMAFSSEMENTPLNPVSADNLQKRIGSQKIRSITETFLEGEVLRSIGTLPFNVQRENAKAYIVISSFIPPDLSKNLSSIAKGWEQYQQIKLLKKPIQITFYITLSIVASLVLFCAVWFGFYIAKSISIPIIELAEGTRRVAEGDLSFSISRVADDEIGSLVESFNQMTRDLRIGREQLEFSAKMLRQQNAEIEERRQYMEIVLKNVSAGVITLGPAGFISTINKSAEKMLQLDPKKILNKNFKTFLKGDWLALATEIIETLANSRDDALAMPLRLSIAGRPRSFLMHFNALKDDARNHLGIVMVFDDLTELEKAQRMAAWREVARRIAHEVKNPLTPIKLSAQRLKRKYSEKIAESVFDECTHMIIDHVDLIRNLVNEFSAFAKFPSANPKLCDLPPIIEETVALYREGHKRIGFHISIDSNIPRLNLDRQQIKQAIINLVDNAVAAIASQGNIWINAMHDPILNMVRLEIADNGKGISDKDKTHLFEPYFSTKKTGMGLGLTIVSTIVSDHYGLIRALDNQPQGAKFVIELPCSK
jgi:two-component system nitrogen regulation sensor histidine kinase NtrY